VSPSPFLAGLANADPFLTVPIEVRVIGYTGFLRGLYESVIERVFYRHPAYGQGPIKPPAVLVADFTTLDTAKIRQ
jgi:hypothetical protein